jgi:chromatin structure-remodeling complex subunit RSC9
MSIQCPDRSQIDWGMFHLVQMSAKKTEKLEFEGFPLMMETLMERALDITRLCTGVSWEIERNQYSWPERRHRPNVMNTLWGTHDILERIKLIPVTLPKDRLETDEYAEDLRLVKQCTLVLRNMCLLPKNAYFIANFSRGLLRDFLAVMLNLPQPPRFNELKNDALDIAEAVTKHLPCAPDDPLCISLYKCLDSSDRAHITGALSALTLYSTEIQGGAPNKAMECDIDPDTLTRLLSFLLLKSDEDLLSGAMDFFYQYTLDRKNVENLAKKVNMAIMFVPRMVDLLSYHAQDLVEETVVQEEKIAPPPSTIPKVPAELFRQLMAMPEPERSSQWLRCCFVEDPDCEITQIALWQAYQHRFGAPQQGGNPQQPNNGALAAADFIKNVSATFTAAQAQVVPPATPQDNQKFIIRGIRPLETALTFSQWPYLYCRWSNGDKPGHFCDRAFAEPRDLRIHVFVDHLDMEPVENTNQYTYEKAKESPKMCQWNHCNHAKYKVPSSNVELLAHHVGGHLLWDRDPKAKPDHKRKVLQPRIARRRSFHDTPMDAQGEPVGVAYKAALVMRNLAWYLPSTGSDVHTRGVPWNKYAFLTHRTAIITKFEYNRTLRGILTDLITLINGFI